MIKPQPLLADNRTRSRTLVGYAKDPAPRILVGLGALTLIAAALRFSTLGMQGYWYDESQTAWLVHAAPHTMLSAVLHHETTPPTYYLLTWVWAKLFSTSEFGLRALPALAGTLTVPATYFAAVGGTRSRRIGLVAAALVATSPLLVWYSQEARDYALLVLCTVMSLGFLARAIERPRTAFLVGWAFFSAAALLVHYFAAFFVALEAIWLLWAARRRFFKQALIACGCVAVVEAALVPFAIQQSDIAGAAWISGLSLRQRILAVPKQFVVGFQSGFEIPAVLIALAVCVYALWLVLRCTYITERRGAILFGGLSALTVAAPLSLAVVGKSYLITRNVIAACVPLLLLLAAGFGARRSGRRGLVGAAVLCVLGIAVSLSVFLTSEYQRADWRGVARALGPAPAPRAIALDYFPLPMEYYLPGSRGMPASGITTSELDVIEIHPSPTHSAFCWWGARCNLIPAIPVTDHLPPGLAFSGARRVNQFTILRFVSATPFQLTPNMLQTSSLGPTITPLTQQPLSPRPSHQGG